MMQRRGFNCGVYLDNFILYENSMDKCATSLATILQLLRALGFDIGWSKVVDPCKKLVFLGIETDLRENRL